MINRTTPPCKWNMFHVILNIFESFFDTPYIQRLAPRNRFWAREIPKESKSAHRFSRRFSETGCVFTELLSESKTTQTENRFVWSIYENLSFVASACRFSLKYIVRRMRTKNIESSAIGSSDHLPASVYGRPVIAVLTPIPLSPVKRVIVFTTVEYQSLRSTTYPPARNFVSSCNDRASRRS